MAQIRINHLTFSYDGSFDNVFEDVSFSIDTNWKLGFIGRNGKGKTTFLNLLMGKYDYQGSIDTNTVFDYFPYNNYVANLHRGEMVLTAREAENYRNGGKTGGDMVFQISINGMQFTNVSDIAHALANDISHELEAQTRRKAALYG